MKSHTQNFVKHRNIIPAELKKSALVPTVPLDLSKCTTVDELLKGYSNTAFGARKVGEAADLLHTMVADKECFVVATVSGAMTMAKMGLVLCDMIDNEMIDVLVTTGA